MRRCAAITTIALGASAGGCAEVHLPPLSATVTIEETGAVIGSANVFSFSYGPIDNVFIDLDNGARLYLTLNALEGPVPVGALIPFEGEPGVLGSPPVEVSYQIPPGTPGSDVIFEACQTSARSEGGVTLEALSRDEDGDVDGLVGTIRVRFVGCEETHGGMALGDVTFVVELPAS